MAKTQTRPKAKAESKPRKRKTDDAEQHERFRRFAREHGADDDAEASEQSMREIIRNSSRSASR